MEFLLLFWTVKIIKFDLAKVRKSMIGMLMSLQKNKHKIQQINRFYDVYMGDKGNYKS